MTNTDKKTKQFNREQIQHCLAIIDQLKPSGLSTLEFSKTQGLSYSQIRAWQSQTPRWRAKLTEDATMAPARRSRLVAHHGVRLDEPGVVLALHRTCSIWEQLFAPEQHRLVKLMVERVDLVSTGLKIKWHALGWKALLEEFAPESIGAELLALEDVL